MRIMRRPHWMILLALAVFFGLNYGWTQAAMARLVSGSPCPPALQTASKASAVALFGDTRSAPIFLCLQKPSLGLSVSHGTTRFAPFLTSIIILGPQGMNADVASHEFAHAELAERTSALLRTYRIPTWFDEGLAMQLDHRADYSQEALRLYVAEGTAPALALADLNRPTGFFRHGNAGKARYAFAKCVVGGWLDKAGKSGVITLIAGVGWFRRFPAEEFKEYERVCLAAAPRAEAWLWKLPPAHSNR